MRGMPSLPLGSTHIRMTLGVACHHGLWAAQTVKRRLSWHAIIAIGLAHTVRRCRAWHSIIALGQETWSNDLERGMPSTPKDSTQERTTSSVACYHLLRATQTVERRRVWHAIIALRQRTQSKDVGRGMTSPPLDSTHGRTTSGVACHNRH